MSVGAIAGSVSGLFLLLVTYFGSHERKAPEPIREVRMEGAAEKTKITSTPGMLYPGLTVEPLRRQDYEIIGPAVGKGCASYIAFWPLPFFYVKREGFTAQIYKYDVERMAERIAMYRALEDAPSADALISPRIHVEEKSTFIWYKRDCVTLTGKALSIKPERKAAGPTQ